MKITIATYFNGKTTKDLMKYARKLEMTLDDLIRMLVEAGLTQLDANKAYEQRPKM